VAWTRMSTPERKYISSRSTDCISKRREKAVPVPGRQRYAIPAHSPV
jgi:hypothetical protein